MESTAIIPGNIHERIVSLVKCYTECENKLIISRRAIVSELFDVCRIKSEEEFKGTKNFLMDVYRNQFQYTTHFRRFVREDFKYDSCIFNCDKMFYDEGCRLKCISQRSGIKKTGEFE